MASLKTVYRSEYNTWITMKSRCGKVKDPRYKHYGGRGIKVCNRWKNFETFLNDMGPRPFPKAQIDRVDNDKGYYPYNCIWTTCLINNRHTSRTKLTLEKAEVIRELYKTGKYTHRSLSELFDVTHQNITSVLNGGTWKL